MKQLAVDLVILNERRSSYVQELQVAIETLVRASQSRPQPGAERPAGGIFVLRADLIPAETRALLTSAARVVLPAQRGGLFEQLERILEPVESARVARKRVVAPLAPPFRPRPPDLEFFNGLGGFARDGAEYVTILGPGQSTPAPWINVIANPTFGFQTATEGGGYTWSVNSRENQLTPWSNDPVGDRSGEAFYLRDDDAGDLWGPTALPIRDAAATYTARHGRGYSRFEHVAHEIASDLVQYVPVDDSIKISRLVLTNRSSRPRRLSVTAYVEWVLGPSRSASLPFVSTELDAVTGAIFARNPWNMGFGSRVAFADLRGAQSDWTGDRREFIGRNGALADPAALAGAAPLSKKVGAGLDPCAAMRTKIELPPGGRVEVVFLLGEAASADEARALIARYRAADLDAVEGEIARKWDDILGAVVVKTPDRAMDVMLNGWLLYQTLSCRIWARSAFYQASGAYGFRDQLQDGMALAAAQPALTREHLLRAAARQFVEGDVQHWWLPHSGQGVRTRISDDRPWLAFAVAHYVDATADVAVLDEMVPFLEGQALEPGEPDSFFAPVVSDRTATLFEHCALALDASLALGGHGLPLMGTGDWNDGMNRVGEKGDGESVWLGWFLYAALTAFVPLAQARGETERAAKWTAHAAGVAGLARARGVGRRLVSAGVFRRRRAAGLGGERGMPHRLDRAILGRALGRRGAGTGGASDGRGRTRADPARRRPGAAVRAAVRQVRAGSRLHQGLSARRARERRPVHPCRRVVGDGLRRARRGRQGGRTVLAAQPDQSRAHPRRRAALQGRALRRRRRRLRGAAPCRARRLDLVHGLGGLDATRGRREHSRAAHARRLSASRSLHSQGVAEVRDERSAAIDAIRNRRRQSRRGQPRRPLRRDRRG